MGRWSEAARALRSRFWERACLLRFDFIGVKTLAVGARSSAMDVPPGPKERRSEERCFGFDEGRLTIDTGAVRNVSHL